MASLAPACHLCTPPSHTTCKSFMLVLAKILALFCRGARLQRTCFGLYRTSVTYQQKEYDLQPLKQNSREGATWYVDPCKQEGEHTIIS
jgi:hypothetical protein